MRNATRPHRVGSVIGLAVAVALFSASGAQAHDDVAPTLVSLDAAIARTPADAALWLRRAELARTLGDLDAALAALERAAAIDPSSGAVALGRATLVFERGNAADAERWLAPLLDADDVPPAVAAPAQLLAARLAAAAGRDRDALTAYDRAFALAPHPTADVAQERAAFALSRGLVDEAAAGVRAARVRLPHDPALAQMAGVLGAPPSPSPASALPGAAPASATSATPRPVVQAEVVLLPRGSTWRYSATGAEPAGWFSPGYDDSSWPSGPGPLGYGDPFIVTHVPMGPDASTRYWTTYFRTTFTVPDPPYLSLTLLANFDDGFLARLNGLEIARRALPGGPIVYSTPASLHEAGTYEAIPVNPAFLAAGTNVLAVEVHQAMTTSTDLAWDGELVATNAALAITRGPYLQDATPTEMTVRWRTNAPTDSRVWLGPVPGALTIAATDTIPVTEHEVRLTGLAPGSTAYYAVGTTTDLMSGDDSLHAITTPPPFGEARPTRLWVLGDSGLPGSGQNRVRDAYTAWTGSTPTDVWLMLGDNAYQTGTDGEYSAGLFAPYAAFLRGHCLWPTRGNHDFTYAGTGNDYYDHFTLPTAGEAGGVPSSNEAWYAFDHGAIHFVCLDSEGSSRTPGSPMLSWLDADLAANTRPWTIAFWHHPPYTKGSHDSDDPIDSEGRMRDMRENVMPILESRGVDLVLTGHSHSYERSYLLDGHYGTSGTLLPSMVLDPGDGSPDGDGAYVKASPVAAPHEGEVVAVAGSSAQISGGTLDHPAMFRSLNVLGSMVIDVDGNTMRGVFLDDLGTVRDSFVMRKGEVVGGPGGDAAGARLALRVAGATPTHGGGPVAFAFALPQAGKARLSIVDAAGRRVRALPLGERTAGEHAATWDGNDESGRRVPAGLYFALLDVGSARRTARVILLP